MRLPLRMTITGALCLALAGGLHAAHAPAAFAQASAPAAAGDRRDSEVRISVSHLAPGSWRVEYELPGDVEQLRFSRAPTTFRRAGWEVETPGLRLVAGDSGDYIAAAGGRPFRRVALRFPSEPIKHEREYVLNPAFTDGSEGLFTGLLYVDAVREGDRSPMIPSLRLAGASGERIVLQGRLSQGPVEWRDARRAGTYVYFGTLEPTTTERVIGIVDPGLPAHLRTMFEEKLPLLMDWFTERLGYPLAARPVILIGYTATPGSNLSSHGDVLPGVIRFGFEGEGWARDDEELRRRAFYLIAHEAAHLWNGELFESAENRRSAWMHEGSADAFAWMAMHEFGVLTDEALLETVEDAANLCLFVTRGAPWGAVMDRPNVPYACGATMNVLVGVGGAERGGLPALWRAVFADAEASGRRYTPASWLAQASALAGEATSTYFSSVLWDAGANSAGTLAAQFARLGARVELDAAPSRGTVSQRLARRALTVLMQSDCAGGYSFGDDEAGFRLNAVAACRTFPRGGSTVTRLDGVSVRTDPGIAYATVARKCAEQAEVAITLAGVDEPIAVRCTEALPPYVRLHAWPALTAGNRGGR